MNCWL